MHDHEDQRQTKRKRILSWIIVILMVLSVAGFYVGSTGDGKTQRYNGIKFTSTPRGVFAAIDGVRYGFTFFPSQVESIPADPGVAALVRGPYLVVTYDPASNHSQSMAAAQYYLAEVLGSRNTYVQPAVTEDDSYNLPLLSCVNATATEPVLLLGEGDETSITIKDSCITAAAAAGEDVLRIQDKILFIALGVMD
ncbi:hypothetical protein HY493_03695 [Candidatus Woesearchaeota archaeon]|nr:hypothetical protein [Candidatus Woesearchaeota archaeon]